MTSRKWGVLSILCLFVFRLGKVSRGEDGILLPCFTENPLSEELKVEWKRRDSTLVYSYQGPEGEFLSGNNDNRALFFVAEAMTGNYSLLLRNVTQNDLGGYTCSVSGKGKYLECVVEVTETDYLMVSGTDRAVSPNVGEEVTMTCSVHSHKPLEEVSWKKLEPDRSFTLVALFKDNEMSEHGTYHGRASLFGSEIPKGNYSLRLTGVKTEDNGEYICEAHSDALSANRSVSMSLGLSSMHILVLASCVAGVVLAVGVMMILIAIKDRNLADSSSAAVWHCVLAIGPGVIMSFAFVIWGVIEGQQGEVVTCAALNLTRVILLFKISHDTAMQNESENLQLSSIPGSSSQQNDVDTVDTDVDVPEVCGNPDVSTSPGSPCRETGDCKSFLSNNCFFLEYIIITNVLTWVIFYNIWYVEGDSKVLAFVGMTSGLSLHMGIKLFFGGKGFLEIMDFFFLFTVYFSSRTLNDDVFQRMFCWVMVTSILFLLSLLFLRWERIRNEGKCEELRTLAYLVWVFIVRLILSAIIFYLLLQVLEPNEELAGFLWTTALLHLLALCGIFDCLTDSKLTECPKKVLYVCGTCGLIAVNAIALGLELIWKWQNGERTVADLRVIVVRSEFAFVLGWMFLWSHAYWEGYRERIWKEVNTFWSQDRGRS
ncbi:uncharacterized protein LOC134438855 isoform X2 [Engraulis encrasicolus]|uniref:uncharacterized protein LOC134438855 isoform X2 n=1 Tax=Engraulis encrasicolus TaxID=184585 RepID=UPI002FD30D0C